MTISEARCWLADRKPFKFGAMTFIACMDSRMQEWAWMCVNRLGFETFHDDYTIWQLTGERVGCMVGAYIPKD